MESTWSPFGAHLEPTWDPLGVPGAHLELTSGPTKKVNEKMEGQRVSKGVPKGLPTSNRYRCKFYPKSTQSRCNVHPKSSNIEPTSLPDALGVILGVSGVPGMLPGRSGNAPERFPDVKERPQELFASPIGVQDVRRSFFACFLCVARCGQSGFRIGFYSTLSMSDDVRVERSGAPKTIEKPSVLASKIEVRGVPGAVRASQNRSQRPQNCIRRPTNAQVTANKRPRRAKGE